MLAAARKKPLRFELILVWKFSRFSRNREHSVLYKRQLERHGVRVVSLNEPVDDSPASRMLEGILEVIDEFYSANLAQNIERGMCRNAKLGFRNGGRAPVGYRKVRTGTENSPRMKLEPDPAWAPVVQRMFQMALSGEGVTAIAAALDVEGLRNPRGKPWTKTRIHSILHNEVYTGVSVWGRTRSKGQAHRKPDPVRVEGTHEPLVSREDFDRVEALLAARDPRRSSPNILRGQYLLSGLLHCARCGARFIGHSAKGGRNHYYGCQSKLKRGAKACDAKLLPRDTAERAVVDALRAEVLTPDYLRDLVGRVNAELSEDAESAQAEAAAIEARLAEARRKLDRLYAALEDGALDLDALAPRIRQWKATVDELEAGLSAARRDAAGKVIHLVDEGTIRRYLDGLHTLLDQGSVSARRAFLRSWITRIDADGTTLTIHYTLPPLPPATDALAATGTDGGGSADGGVSPPVLPPVGSGDPNETVFELGGGGGAGGGADGDGRRRALRLGPPDPVHSVEPPVIGQDLGEPVGFQHAQMYAIPGGERWVGGQQAPRAAHLVLTYRQDGDAKRDDAVEDPEPQIGSSDAPIAMEDLLEHLRVGTRCGSLPAHGRGQERTGRAPLRALPTGGVHEDVGIEQDHRRRPAIDSSIIVSTSSTGASSEKSWARARRGPRSDSPSSRRASSRRMPRAHSATGMPAREAAALTSANSGSSTGIWIRFVIAMNMSIAARRATTTSGSNPVRGGPATSRNHELEEW